MFLVHDATGAAVSIGTAVADPLPSGLTAVALSDADAQGLTSGALRWNPATKATEPAPAPIAEPAVESSGLAARVKHLEEAIEGASSFADLKRRAKP